MEDKVEYHFLLPIDQLIYKDEHTYCKELCEISKIMNIKVDMELLLMKFNSYKRGEGDILVFSNKYETDSFILFDFYRGYCDQNDMVTIAVRCHNDNSLLIKDILIDLYDKGSPRSEFIVDNHDNLKNSIRIENFPREIKDDWMKMSNNQHIECYVDGVLITRI